MRSLIAIVGVLLLIAAVAKASPNPVRLLLWCSPLLTRGMAARDEAAAILSFDRARVPLILGPVETFPPCGRAESIPRVFRCWGWHLLTDGAVSRPCITQ